MSLAVKIFEILKNEKADILVIMSGDTDFVPAIETAKRLYPQNEFIVIFPAYRWNNELKKVANRTFTIKAKRYNTYQFPQDIHFKGQILTKPSHW